MNNYLKTALLFTALTLSGFDPADLVDNFTSTTAQHHSKIDAVTNAARAPATAPQPGN